MPDTPAHLAPSRQASGASAPTETKGGGLAIDVTDAAKTYRGRVQALRGISMQVHRGEVFGLLGPNGAGKSTLVKILMTVIRATRVKGTMLGAPIGSKSVLRRVGYLPEHHKFPEYLSAEQVLDYYGALAQVPRAQRHKRADELLALVGLADWRKKKVKGFSKGMRQRLGIAQALINDPELVLLDEPTDGVDPVGRREIREILVGLRARGKTVLVNSHILSELEMVCDRVAILVQGAVSSQGTITELTSYGRRYEIEIAGDPAAGPSAPSSRPLPNGSSPTLGNLLRDALLLPGLVRDLEPTGSLQDLAQPAHIVLSGSPGRPVLRGTLPGGEAVELDGHIIRVATDEAATVQPLIDALRARGLVVRAVRPIRPSLEDLFMRAVTDPLTGKALAPGALRPAKRGNPE